MGTTGILVRRSTRLSTSLAHRPATGRPLALRVDFALVLTTLLVAGIGVVLVYSATRSKLAAADGSTPITSSTRQAAYVVVGFVFMVVLAALDYRWLEHASAVLYVAMILALLAMFSGIGSARWAPRAGSRSDGVQIQPSAFATLVLIVTVATFCARRPEGLGRNDLLKVLALAAVPILLVVKQPDLGSGIVMSVVLLVMLVIAGIPNRYLLLLVLLTVTGSVRGGALQAPQGLPAHPDHLGLPRREEPPEHRVQRGPVGGGHRVGRLVGDGVVPRTPDQPGLRARAADRLHLLGARASSSASSARPVSWRCSGSCRGGCCEAPSWPATPSAASWRRAASPWWPSACSRTPGWPWASCPWPGSPFPFLSYGGSATVAFFSAIGIALSVHLRAQR